ncbi:MAG: hypothetical protein JNL74_13880 [Fibrobacteres bacterium]|nr:hypothetical protein [Fibrobacterota bacterium]
MLKRLSAILAILCLSSMAASEIKNPYYKELSLKTFEKNGIEYIPLVGAVRFPNSAWGSIGYAKEGFVYVVVCDHIANAAIYEYNTKTGKLFSLGDLSELLGLKSYAERQPKVHTPLIQYEKNGLIYFGTDAGDPSEGVMFDHQREGYYGGFFASLNPVTKEVKNLGRHKPHAGFKSLHIDQKNGYVYTTQPGANLVRYVIATNSFETLGKVNGSDIPRTMFQDKWSNIYSATETAEIFRFNLAKNELEFLNITLPGLSVTGPSQVAHSANGDTVYGVTHYTGHVYRYMPEQNGRGKVDSLTNVSFDAGKAGIRNLNYSAGKLYMIVTGREVEEGGDSVAHSKLTIVDCISGNIDKRVEVDDAICLSYGPPVSDAKGNCYTTGFMDNLTSTRYKGNKAIVHLVKFNPKKL